MFNVPAGVTQRQEEVEYFRGDHIIIDLPNGWGLSAINGVSARDYPYAWEFAVFHNGSLDYSTELTSDVEVFSTQDEAQAFVDRAIKVLEILP